MKTIDLRSDTVTLPTSEMMDAINSAPLGDDVYVEDSATLELEALAAKITGMTNSNCELITFCLMGAEVQVFSRACFHIFIVLG